MSAFNPLKFIVASLATAAMVAAVGITIGIALGVVKPGMTRPVSFSSIYNTNGRQIVPPYSDFNSVFSPEVWASKPDERIEQFSYFLKSHTIIGMRKSDVERYLGNAGDSNCYSTSTAFCASANTWLELRYQDEIVTGWRRRNYGGERAAGPWVTTDLVYECVNKSRVSPEIRLYPRNQR